MISNRRRFIELQKKRRSDLVLDSLRMPLTFHHTWSLLHRFVKSGLRFMGSLLDCVSSQDSILILINLVAKRIQQSASTDLGISHDRSLLAFRI